MMWIAVLFIPLLWTCGSCGLAHEKEVVVKIKGGIMVARKVAREIGYTFNGAVHGFHDLYSFIPLEVERDHVMSGGLFQKRGTAHLHQQGIHDDYRVEWAEAQLPKLRKKRDFLHLDSTSKSSPIRKPLRVDRSFNDELWSQEWYLQDTRTRPDLPKLDLNVLPLYRYGVTGRGVRISILDDGIEHTHDDLAANYDPAISYDCNEEDADPLPRYDATRANSHGTRCAGEVAMTADNGKCGVGVAFGARVGGVKLLDGLVNDRIEGTALSYARHLVDIYSASWGPNDDGKTVDGPGSLAQEALERGVNEGRNGKGSIYVWASGNGGSQGDNCNCDGYLTSPYTISIGSASQRGEFPWYGEPCASTLAVTYSSGAYQDQMIATTDLHNQCTIKHTGTSASAPLAAGIIALALEVNPLLTWRDVQHLIVWTSEPAPVGDDPDWTLNAAGFWTSIRFGYGLMNAFAFVAAAANWTQVPQRHTCHVPAAIRNMSFGYGDPAMLPITTNACEGTGNVVGYLEHVEVELDVAYTIRGAVEVHLTSPRGTKVQLLATRRLDESPDGFDQWRFMSVMTWGEPPNGLWILHVADNLGPITNYGHVSNITLILHGTSERPEHMANGPRSYDHEYNRVRDETGSVKYRIDHHFKADQHYDGFLLHNLAED